MEQTDSSFVAAPPTVAGALGKERAAWPSTLGIMSIVLGLLGLLRHTCGLSSLLMGALTLGAGTAGQGSPGSSQGEQEMMRAYGMWTLASGAASALAFLLAAWLLVAGIMLLNRRRSSVGQLRLWACLRIVVALLAAGAAFGANATLMSHAAKLGASQGSTPLPPGASMMMMAGTGIYAVVMLLVGIAYPIAVLITLSRPWAKQEVLQWR
jgi:hypothetical protein